MSERVQKRKAHIAVNLASADRTGLRKGSDTIDFQRFNVLVAFFVAVDCEMRDLFTKTYLFERN